MLTDVVINTNPQSDDAEHIDIHLIAILPSLEHEGQYNDEREHKNSLIPTEDTGKKVIHMGVNKRRNG